MPRLNRIPSALVAGAIACGLANTAWAQDSSREAFKREMAMDVLSLREAITEVCKQQFPRESQVMQAQWQAKLKDPASKALIESPDYPKKLAANRELARTMATPKNGAPTPEQQARFKADCQAGLQD